MASPADDGRVDHRNDDAWAGAARKDVRMVWKSRVALVAMDSAPGPVSFPSGSSGSSTTGLGSDFATRRTMDSPPSDCHTSSSVCESDERMASRAEAAGAGSGPGSGSSVVVPASGSPFFSDASSWANDGLACSAFSTWSAMEGSPRGGVIGGAVSGGVVSAGS